jgi:hypothetical protein
MSKLACLAVVATALAVGGCSNPADPTDGVEFRQARGEQTKPRGIQPPSPDSTSQVVTEPDR